MKTKKVGKVITILKDHIGHPLKRHLTKIPTLVNIITLTQISCHSKNHSQLFLTKEIWRQNLGSEYHLTDFN